MQNCAHFACLISFQLEVLWNMHLKKWHFFLFLINSVNATILRVYKEELAFYQQKFRCCSFSFGKKVNVYNTFLNY